MSLESGVYVIANAGTDTALDLKGRPVQGWERLGGVDRYPQLWYVETIDWSKPDDKGQFTVANIGSNKYLDLAGSNAANGTEIIGYTYHKTPNQHWVIKNPSSESYYRIQNVKTKTFVDLYKGQKENGTKVQGWAGSWDDGSQNRAWNFDQKSLRGGQIRTILDENPKIKGKVIVQYPDRIYFAPDQALLEFIWDKSGLADVKPRPPLFDGESYEKVFKGYVLSHANETIKVDGFDILSATVSCVEDATQEISALTAVLTGDKSLDKALFFDPKTGKAYDDIPKGLTVRSVIL